ncbi:MAG: DsrE family protein, partial [Candidatus Limnocylindrales bacterium]
QDAVVLLTIDGAWLAVRGRADGVAHEGLPPLREVMTQFIAAGGRIWACGACTKPRGIQAEDLADGATIVTAAQVVELLASGAASMTF